MWVLDNIISYAAADYLQLDFWQSTFTKYSCTSILKVHYDPFAAEATHIIILYGLILNWELMVASVAWKQHN